MSTPHNNAKLGDFAKTVLMPGDPKRSEYIAKTFLSDITLVNDVRGVKGYTGYYNGTKVSVMASGMGMPSMGIYAYELFKFFGVENIIRVGSCGALIESLDLYDIVLAQGACTDSNFASQYNLPGTFAPICDFKLLKTAVEACDNSDKKYYVGNVLSSDRFYSDSTSALDFAKMGVLAVEMESAALYMTAKRLSKRALSILTVSDNLVTGKETSSDERERSFSDMIKVALSVAVEMDKYE